MDPTGKILLITHPDLLGEEFAKRYGNSTTNSPSIGFEELIDDSEAGDGQQTGNITPANGMDIMLASLNSSAADPANPGQATGPHEAFYPAPGFQLGDYELDADDFEGDYQDDGELGEDVINMDDVIKFDDDSGDSDAPTSPIFMPPMKDLTNFSNTNGFSHLTNENVTAFRNNADPSFAPFSNTAAYSNFPDFSTPTRPRKRKTTNDSPYTSSHYNGVTPVQRVRDPNPSTPETTVPRKRRRLMTA